ncbi:MAG TPA: DUF5667 domain-containing protein [Candidatus Paceibacterota bacterium]
MSNDNHLHEYKGKWEQVKLSDSARARIRENLEGYAAFHPVRTGGEGRSMKQVPSGAFLHTFNFNRMKTMPIAVLAMLLVGGGTTFAAQNAVPGDLLYPVKIGVNENVRAALAFDANAKAQLEADLFEERVEEAAKLQAEGRLTGETAAKVAANLKTQAKVTADAIAKSDAAVAADTTADVTVALESALGLIGLDTNIAADFSSSFGTTLSTGTIGIDSYLSDMKVRVNTYRTLMEKYATSLEAEVKAELTAKLDTAALLVVEASGKAEADARTSLDKAAVLLGEVEATLSTLGQVEVENGVITDIDFSIDPMQIDIGAGTTGSAGGSQGGTDPVPPDYLPAQTDPAASGGIQIDADAAVDSDSIDVDGALEATSGLGI